MNCSSALGGWVSGPFANTEIEGFIVEESFGCYKVMVSKITVLTGKCNKRLAIGTVHTFPKRVVDDFFVRLDADDQKSMIRLAASLNQIGWVNELVERFSYPKKKVINEIFSSYLKSNIVFFEDTQRQLYSLYLHTEPHQVMSGIYAPEDICDEETLDAVIKAIVSNQHKNKKGSCYIKSLMRD